MASASTQDMTYMIPELGNLDSGVVSFWLSEAQRLVILDGFAVADDNFDLLQRYMCGHLLFINNIVRGTVTSENVSGSIALSYGIMTDPNYTDQWWKKYVALKSQLMGDLGGSRVV